MYQLERIGSADDVERGGGVEHRPREHAARGQPFELVHAVRDAVAARLQADEPVARRGDANRPAAIGGVGDRAPCPTPTAAPAPPLDPPGVWSGFHGLRVTPCASLSVYETVPNSGAFVMPRRMNPASTNRSTTKSDSVCGSQLVPRDPCVDGQPATAFRSLIGNGTPKNGGSSSVSRRGDDIGRPLGRVAHLVVGSMAERVERSVELLDPIEVQVGHFDGADLLATDGGGDLDGWSEGIHGP